MAESPPEAERGPDPRAAPSSLERDVRPVVAVPRAGLSGAAVAGLAVVAGLGLFGVLEARRQPTTAPAITPTRNDAVGSMAPPPLYVPPAPLPDAITIVPPFPAQQTRLTAAAPPPAPPPPPAPDVQAPVYNGPSPSPISAPSRQAPRNVSGQALVVDTSSQASPRDAEDQRDDNNQTTGNNERPRLSTTRARAAMLANRSTTVPQGTLISAVLETAFDSTSPGFARALVQKDVHGFDGTQVLIPRGSRLIGEYGADTARGQQRAIILWSRLIRPDGVTIAIGSPAADTVGRGGVKADVNSHFLERFSGAILQSALDVGVNLAARSSRSPVIVALPGTSSAVTNAAAARTIDITPTLRVPAGRSVSVFVARDLDFTTAGAAR